MGDFNYMKSDRIRLLYWSAFSQYGLKTEIYPVNLLPNLCIKFKYGKI